MRTWSQQDDRNPALKRELPVQFVRSTVIRNVNRDLALAATAGVAASIDSLHLKVVAQRFAEDAGWKLQGYALPILFPSVGELPWVAIADLRRDRAIGRFRAVLREVEQEAMTEAAGGNIGTAAHHAYENHLAKAVGRIDGVASSVSHSIVGLMIGGTAGLATSGLTGPTGIIAGAIAGWAPGAALDAEGFSNCAEREGGWQYITESPRRPDKNLSYRDQVTGICPVLHSARLVAAGFAQPGCRERAGAAAGERVPRSRGRDGCAAAADVGWSANRPVEPE
jgi:hypothetical protein